MVIVVYATNSHMKDGAISHVVVGTPKAEPSEPTWTNSEQTMLRIFRPMWPSNFCQLAKVLSSKTLLHWITFSS